MRRIGSRWKDSRIYRKNIIKRKECKYHFTNILVAIVNHARRIRSVGDFELLSEDMQDIWLEWLVAQELNRRRSINT